MGLNKTGLKTGIKSMMDALKTEKDQEAAIEKAATDLSNAIDTYTKTALVSVSVAVDPGSHTGSGTGTLS